MKGRNALSGVFSIPNLLSLLRLLLIPVFIIMFFSSFPNHRGVAAAVLVLSGLTDCLDGFIARRFNMVTEIGKLLDPLADKLTQAAVCICLFIAYPWLIWLLVLFIVKEALMIAGGLGILRKGLAIGSSRWYGKLSTVIFYIVMITVIAFPLLPDQAVLALILIALGFMVFSFVMYLGVYIRLVRNRPQR